MNNFVKRTLSSVVIFVVTVFGVIWDRTLFGALFLFVLLMALKEFYAITLGEKYKFQQKLGIITGLSAFIVVAGYYFYGWDLRWLALVLAELLLIPVSAVLFSSYDEFESFGSIFAGLLYIALPVALSPMMVMDGEVFDGWLLLSFFIIIWVSDVGAYCLGTLFGQGPDSKRLAPKISPKKSWVGFWSGMAFSVAAAFGLHFLTWLPFSIWHCIALGVIINLGGVCGDLFESMWKRRFGVKDSGNIIPGHGGMLDRIDSMLIAVPLGAAYLAIFNLL